MDKTKPRGELTTINTTVNNSLGRFLPDRTFCKHSVLCLRGKPAHTTTLKEKIMSKKNLNLIKQIMFHAYREACRNNRPMSIIIR